MTSHCQAGESAELEDDTFLDDSANNVICSPSSESDRDRERRLRREIANSNERRRMQSINTGFQALRMLIPNAEGEKLSKAAILQQTSEYIFSLEQDKTRLLQQNTTLKRILSHCERNGQIKSEENRLPCKRSRSTSDTENTEQTRGISNHTKQPRTKDENYNDITDDSLLDDLQRELIDLRCQLEKERRLRISLEEQKQKFESDLNELKSKSHRNTNKALATTRQNLDTIVQAIKHLEGDGPECDETPIKFKSDILGSNSDFTSRRLIV